jgi:ABC-type sugar transport system ATPase subunit
MAELQLKDVRKSFGAVDVIKGVSLEIKSGEFMVFVGPSGCGKSTLLRLVAGLEDITSGTLEFDGQVVNGLAPSKRGIAMVFQSYALYPHMNVFDNMAFGMQLAHASRDQIRERVEKAADLLQIRQYLDRLPKQLSGGQRQRVAIGRAIVRDPKVFLFDEPLSNLDAALRVATRLEIAKLHHSMNNVTMIYVTHDQVEAMTLADRIVILNKGRIEQRGSPLELYERPANRFVAGFLGQPRMNFVPTIAEHLPAGTGLVIAASATTVLTLGEDVRLSDGAKVDLGIRPDAISLAEPGTDGAVPARIVVVEHLGGSTLLYVQVDGLDDLLTVEQRGKADFARDQTVGLLFDPGQSHLFDRTGRRIESGGRH